MAACLLGITSPIRSEYHVLPLQWTVLALCARKLHLQPVLPLHCGIYLQGLSAEVEEGGKGSRINEGECGSTAEQTKDHLLYSLQRFGAYLHWSLRGVSSEGGSKLKRRRFQ